MVVEILPEASFLSAILPQSRPLRNLPDKRVPKMIPEIDEVLLHTIYFEIVQNFLSPTAGLLPILTIVVIPTSLVRHKSR